MYFSDYFNIQKQTVEDYGAIDINLICDLPLFIDPMLIFNSHKSEYTALHNDIIHYFHFLARKSDIGFREGDFLTYFNFGEIKNNWLGYSKEGNEGNGNGETFSRFLANNIKFALQTHDISLGTHFEKVLLLFSGSGRDKISDLTTKLILDYLAKYTQTFSISNIDVQHLDTFYLDSVFNYETETFESVEYTLPYYINRKGYREFILLTPRDILRKDEPTINRIDLKNNYHKIRDIIDNVSIRSQLDNYIAKAVAEYEAKCLAQNSKINEKTIEKIEKSAFMESLQHIPEIYDYYVKLKETEKEFIREEALIETTDQIEKLCLSSWQLVRLFKTKYKTPILAVSAQEEAKQRLKYFKHIIEDCDGYKNLYHNGQKISDEDDLQRLFRFAWYESQFDVNYETNNGRGESDIKVSLGSRSKCIVEFKLASNRKLAKIFAQMDVYAKANQSKDNLYAIFCFSADEQRIVNNMLIEAGKQELVDDKIFIIDCRNDNKLSGSRV
jgi:hypothetical protein